MTITSKFPDKCNVCGFAIKVGEQVDWQRGVGVRHLTTARCEEARAATEQARIAREAAAPKLDLKKISDFLHAAKDRGLKSPKLRVLAPDGKSEMRLSLTRGGVAPGSIAVKVLEEFQGCVRTTGATTGKLSSDEKLQKHILYIAENPAQAAKEYAALMGLCSFCGKQLTDAGSVEVGYGPICAEKYGLPHRPQGTPVLHPVHA